MSATRPQDPGSTKEGRQDAALERARSDAEGVTVFTSRPSIAGEVAEREEAQGVTVFKDPDSVIPRAALRGGAPGEESLDPDQLDPDDMLDEEAYDGGVSGYPEDIEP